MKRLLLFLPLLLLCGCHREPEPLTLRVTGSTSHAIVSYGMNNQPLFKDENNITFPLPFEVALPEQDGVSYDVWAFGTDHPDNPPAGKLTKVNIEFRRGDDVVASCGDGKATGGAIIGDMPPTGGMFAAMSLASRCQYTIPSK